MLGPASPAKKRLRRLLAIGTALLPGCRSVDRGRGADAGLAGTRGQAAGPMPVEPILGKIDAPSSSSTPRNLYALRPSTMEHTRKKGSWT